MEESLPSLDRSPIEPNSARWNDELEWMRCVAGGDGEAMEQLLERYQVGIRVLVGRLTAWGPDTDDLTQEIFLKAWQRASQFQRGTSLQNWLYTIAVNQCRNHRRGLQRWWRMLDRLFEHKRGEAVTPLLARAEQEESWNELQQALLQLRLADRELLVLTYMEQKSSHEIAQILGITENNYYVRIHRAKERLTEHLVRVRTQVTS